MSNAVLNACWPLQMPPTAKFVLIALADHANDRGACWPSIATIAQRTGFGRTAVITALHWLERQGAIEADRSNGRRTSYRVTADKFQQSASRTGPGVGPAREPNRFGTETGPGDATDQFVSRTAPVRQADPNRQEPSVILSSLPGVRGRGAAAGEAAAALSRVGLRITSQHPDLIAACDEGVTIAQLLELQGIHPGKPALYLIAIARRHIAEGPNAAITGVNSNATRRHLSAVDRIAANIERARQRDGEHEGVIEGHAIRVSS